MMFSLHSCCSKLIVVYSCLLVIVTDAANEFTIGVFGAQPYNNIVTQYSGRESVSVSCFQNGHCVRLKHNGTIVETNDHILHYVFDILQLNDSGIYTCESLPLTECETDNVITSDNRTLLVIDSSSVNVPVYQFVYVNESYSLVCDSVEYELTVNKWTKNGNSNKTDSIINDAQLIDEGNYTCHFSIYDNNNTNTTQLIVLVKPTITDMPTNQIPLVAVGPSINNYTITYTAKSPGNAVARWYHNDIELIDRMVNESHDTGGYTTIQVYQRSHGGNYRVIIESLFNGLQVSDNIMQQSTIEYTFDIIVVVPPTIPTVSLLNTTPFEATVLILHNNITTDDAPDTITLTLNDNNNNVINVIELPGHHTQYTFHNLTPAQQYNVSMSVRNNNGTKDGETIILTTNTTEPLLSDVTIIRTDLLIMNITLLYSYIGAQSINSVVVGYRSVNSITHSYQSIDITDQFIDMESLYMTAQFNINDNYKGHMLEFILDITNSDNKRITTDNKQPIIETIEPLSTPSRVSIITLTEDSVSLILQLPSIGTPPILQISYSFTSLIHSFTINISGYFMQGQKHNLITSEQEVELMSNTRYTVTTRTRNFVGWSDISNGTEFTTYQSDITEAVINTSEKGLSFPIWAIILSGVIPTITIILLIVSSILFVFLIKKYLKKPKGYPINEVTAADKNRLDRSPGESRRIAKFFSYEKPLMPRAPTAEPFDMYPYPPSSSHDDSDSETNLTNTPKYKYVVSPTHNEIGIQGFLGSAPGSGTFVYV